MFMNKYRELRSGWALLLCAASIFLVQGVVGTVAQIIMLMVTQSLTPAEMMEQAEALATHPALMLVANILTIAVCILLFKLLYARPLRQMGLSGKKWGGPFIHGLVLGAAAIVLVFLALLLTGQAVVNSVNWATLTGGRFWISLATFICVGFGEEIMSRGYMMTALKTTRLKAVIVGGPAVLFALLHMANPNVSLLSLVNIFLIGIAFAYMFIRTGSLWMPIGFHITWNFFQGNILGMNVSGIATVSVLETAFTGNPMITGGYFGAEGGLVVTVACLLCIVYTRYFVKPPASPLWGTGSDMPLTRGTNHP